MDERGTIIPEEQHHYIEKDDYNKCIYHKRDMDATERTIVVMNDADDLIKICDSTGDFDDTSEYQLLIRLLKERTIIDNDGSRRLRQKRKLKIHQKYYLIHRILKQPLDIKLVASILDMLEMLLNQLEKTEV